MIGLMLAICYAIYFTSGMLERAIGPRGLNVAGRLLGVLLAALAVQFVADGVMALSH